MNKNVFKSILKGLKWFLNSYIWIFPMLLAVDIITKNLVVHSLELGQSVDLIHGFLAITYSINDKAAFSIGFSNALVNKIMYSCFAGIATIVIIVLFVKKYKEFNGLVKAALMLILTGAIGNLIDRLFYTPEYLHSGSSLCGVVDWIDFYGIWGAIFNIADSCVVIAAIMLIIYFVISEVKEERQNPPAKAEKTAQKSKTEQSMEDSRNTVSK